ncbi:MAG: hypothetical protein H0V79_06625 [Actinobacteria bacterium]|nr:hypothetical protein [Actinomycetota bacterium]MBA3739228.1 hypothetical protein [Actinomycetota bacterium]
MLRTLTVLSLVCGLAVAGWMWTRQSFQTTDPAPTAILQAATTALELSHRTNGTYAGVTPTPDTVTVVHADVTSYCIEFAGYFVAGPGGVPTPGACPR